MKKEFVSIVVSLYNEELGALHFAESLFSQIESIGDTEFEVIWVNDGSTDKTQQCIDNIVEKHRQPQIHHVSIEFSRNFGHEAAIIAGIDLAQGEAIICMDSDGQHPPEKISEMLDKFKSGSDIVLAERISRKDGGLLKRKFSRLFYKLINALSSFKFNQNTTDFFLISRQVSTVLKENYRERTRFIRGFIQSVGFSKSVVYFSAPKRIYGESSYSFRSLFKLAFNAIFSFSNKPLRLCITVASIFIIFTIVLATYTLFVYIFGETPPSGYTTLILFLSLSFSLLFIIITILALYFEKVIEEIRQRPIYIVRNIKR
ncbi:MAG TPA: glycosyltransferase family 2 protein [Tenuifilaceae bacterium]|nr:glycosyltransferase family 2 protein [Tenuifilaceae bacterium]